MTARRQGRVGVVAVSRAGSAHAARLRAAWPREHGGADAVDVLDVADHGGFATTLRAAWATYPQVVAFCASGVAVRVLAGQLAHKQDDPGVVVVDEGARFAVALLGGHAGGANALAATVADVLGAQPVVTTATDSVGLPGLDDLGLPVDGDVASVTRAILDGEHVALDVDGEHAWPLPAPVATLPALDPAKTPAGIVRISDRLHAPATAGVPRVVLRPPSLVAGVGASRGAPADEIEALLRRVLADHGLHPGSLTALATADVKADEPGIVEVARRLGLPLHTHHAGALAQVSVPNPSGVVLAAVGTPSVAEAAALLGDSKRRRDATLIAAKTASPMATVAIARHRPRGRLALVGIGPGSRDLLPPAARAELRRAAVVVGLDQYVDQVADLLRPCTRVLASGLGHEEERARDAVAQAAAGHAVALIGSGDAGVYAMASPALEHADDSFDVVGVPGITAALAASSLLGAPLGHDHAAISLSDLHTSWEVIERRVRALADADLVVSFYNPRSRTRQRHLPWALQTLAARRPPDTPVGVVRNATRPDQQVWITRLDSLITDLETYSDLTRIVDMLSVVVVGSSTTRLVAGRMVTPRDYRWSGTP